MPEEERPATRRARTFRLAARVSSGVKNIEFWACTICGALVVPCDCDAHTAWHQGQR
jgi:hypothetical protein